MTPLFLTRWLVVCAGFAIHAGQAAHPWVKRAGLHGPWNQLPHAAARIPLGGALWQRPLVRRCFLSLALSLALTVVACTPSGSSSPLDNTRWRIEAYGDVQQPHQAGPEMLTMTFFADEHKVRGKTACNYYDATYQTQGETITFRETIQTVMGCEQQQTELERVFMQAFSAIDRYQIDGGQIELRGGDRMIIRGVRMAMATPVPTETRTPLRPAIPTDAGTPTPYHPPTRTPVAPRSP